MGWEYRKCYVSIGAELWIVERCNINCTVNFSNMKRDATHPNVEL